MSGWYDPVHAPQPPVSDSFPHTLTQDEYDKKWKPAGWRLIVIGPTATWRQEWGEWEAIRDIVQNCLDESEAYQFGYDQEGLWIADKGTGVAVADFLLGPPKLKPDWARGKFGEGMKIAALALLRKGYGVHVHTVRRELYITFLEQQVNGRVQTLAALWKPNGTAKGTRFHIVGYRGTAFDDRFAVNIPPSGVLAEVASPITQPKQRFNQLLRKEPGKKGTMYVRDIYLKDIDSPWSYNLWGFDLSPDRHGPREEDHMYADMGRLWSGITAVSLLKQLLPLLTYPPMKRSLEGLDYVESNRMEFNIWGMGVNPTTNVRYANAMGGNAPKWQKAWDEVIGKNKVMETNTRLTNMVKHLGYESQQVSPHAMHGIQLVIKTDETLVREMSDRLDQAQRVPDDQLTSKQLNHLVLARHIAEGFREIGPVNAGIIPPASDMVERTAGLYEFDTGMIKINVDMLESAQKTVGVMVHELGHHVAYLNTSRDKEKAGDLQPAHAHAMEEVAGRIFKGLVRGDYDVELKYAVW